MEKNQSLSKEKVFVVVLKKKKNTGSTVVNPKLKWSSDGVLLEGWKRNFWNVKVYAQTPRKKQLPAAYKLGENNLPQMPSSFIPIIMIKVSLMLFYV